MRKRILVLLPLVAALSACWQSDEQLFPADQAVALPIAGTYTYAASDGTTGPVTIKADDDHYYIYHSGASDDAPDDRQLRFLPLEGGWYLVQSQDIADGIASQMSEYRVVKIGSGAMKDYDPACSPDDTKYAGVSYDDGDCTFGNFAGLRALAIARVEAFDGGDSDALDYAGTYTR